MALLSLVYRDQLSSSRAKAYRLTFDFVCEELTEHALRQDDGCLLSLAHGLARRSFQACSQRVSTTGDFPTLTRC